MHKMTSIHQSFNQFKGNIYYVPQGHKQWETIYRTGTRFFLPEKKMSLQNPAAPVPPCILNLLAPPPQAPDDPIFIKNKIHSIKIIEKVLAIHF